MIIVILLALLGLPLYFGLFSEHIVGGHDAASGLIRAICMDKYLGDGQILPRWLPDVNFGFGSPMFNFYPPFFYFLSVVLSKVTHNMLLAMNWVCIILWIVSGIGIYLLAKEFWGRKGGLVSAIAYMYAPYHIQDLYVRGAFAEFSAFAFFPLIILAFYKISKKIEVKYVVLGTLGITSLSLTHNVMSMLFLPVLMSYIVFLSILRKNIYIFLFNFAMVVVGLMMAAFFWLPAFNEKSSLNMLLLVLFHYDFHQHFLSLAQLFNTPWAVNPEDQTKLPYHVGLFPVILVVVSLGLVIKRFKENKEMSLHYLFFLFVTIVAMLFTLPITEIIWEKVILLRCIQFPWRLLAIISFFVSLMAGGIMLINKSKVVSNFILIGVMIVIMLSSAKLISSIKFKNIDQVKIKEHLSELTFLGEGEYTPRWIMKVPTSKLPDKFMFLQGSGTLTEYKKINAVEHTIRVMSFQPAMLCFGSFYFPGWEAFIDGKSTPLRADNQYGLAVFVVPPGDHLVKMVFRTTPIRQLAVRISWGGLILFIIGLFLIRKSNWSRS